jgi:hypothetical protein
MDRVVVALAVLLIVGVWAGSMVVMIRSARAQRARITRTDFGGRYSYFGFVLGKLGAADRRRDADDDASGASGVDRDGRP